MNELVIFLKIFLAFSIKKLAKENEDHFGTLGDFRNISTISILLLAVVPYNFYYFDTKMA